MAENKSPIGIFDSGVGGLSVLSEINKILPKETTIFFADQKFVPYGTKSKKELVDRVLAIANFLVKKDVKAIVIACNTATVYAIDEARAKFKIPIIGTVPVIKTIANITKSGKVAVFSTPATAKSKYLSLLIKKFANGVKVEKIGGSNLEALVEEGDLENPKIDAVLKKVLKPLLNDGIDSIALGCTHYPFLRPKIQKIVGEDIQIVDSGGAVARRLKKILTIEKLLANEKGRDLYYTTFNTSRFENAVEKLLGKNIKAKLASI